MTLYVAVDAGSDYRIETDIAAAMTANEQSTDPGVLGPGECASTDPGDGEHTALWGYLNIAGAWHVYTVSASEKANYDAAPNGTWQSLGVLCYVRTAMSTYDGTYHIEPAPGGMIGPRTLLSAISDGSDVVLWDEDDASGRQRWTLETVDFTSQGFKCCHIQVVGGISDSDRYLSAANDGWGSAVYLQPETDEWMLEPVTAYTDAVYYYVRPRRNTSLNLSTSATGDEIRLVTDGDESAGQAWRLSQVSDASSADYELFVDALCGDDAVDVKFEEVWNTCVDASNPCQSLNHATQFLHNDSSVRNVLH